jgi:hypothetical protein
VTPALQRAGPADRTWGFEMDRAYENILPRKISAQTDQGCPSYGPLKFYQKVVIKGVGMGGHHFENQRYPAEAAVRPAVCV